MVDMDYVREMAGGGNLGRAGDGLSRLPQRRQSLYRILYTLYITREG
jgi:hypothetical protein